MIDESRLKEIAEKTGGVVQEMARELLALRWQPITPDNLPNVGDELLSEGDLVDVVTPAKLCAPGISTEDGLTAAPPAK